MATIYRSLEIDLPHAQLAGEWHEFSQHVCWQRLKTHMAEQVAEAKKELDGCLSGDPLVHMRLNIRHQQRNAMMLSVAGLVEDWNQERQDIIESLSSNEERQDVNDSNHA